MKPVGLVRAGCALSVVVLGLACSDSKKKDALYEIPIGDPVNVFTSESPEADAFTAGTASIEEGLACGEPTTEQRLQGSLMGANFRFVSRTVSEPNAPRSIRDEELGYTFDHVANRYTRSVKINQLSHRGQSALGGVPLAYIDSCSSTRCNESERRYTSGSPLHNFEVESRITQLRMRDIFLPQTSCRLIPDGVGRKQTVQRGVINLDGVNYKAVKFTTKTPGRISCEVGVIENPRTSGKIQDFGTGESVDVEIVLADKLPAMPSQIGLPLVTTSTGRACERTRVFQSSYIMQGPKIFRGTAIDVANARINAVIQSVAEFKAAKQRRADILQRLRDQVTVLKLDKVNAEREADEAPAKARDAKIKELEAVRAANEAQSLALRNGSTDADREKYMELNGKAKLAAELTKNLEQAVADKRANVARVNQHLAEAEAALRKFELENR